MEPVDICYINVKSGYCRCAPFDFSYGKLQSVGESTNYPIDHCHKNLSMNSQAWEKLNGYFIDIYKFKDKKFKTNDAKKRESQSDILEFIRENYAEE
jgi:hypothetical protein